MMNDIAECCGGWRFVGWFSYQQVTEKFNPITWNGSNIFRNYGIRVGFCSYWVVSCDPTPTPICTVMMKFIFACSVLASLPNRRQMFTMVNHTLQLSGVTTPPSPIFILMFIRHDCGVCVMIFMDVLTFTSRMMYFKQSDIRILRDKCLVDILRGRIRYFPMTLP
ncbi:hypothetical protein Cgig2_023616 [Carnegiea gigantea]|uniref:Uncharacterized protein n=1 Tax=Carnegiea gigantea TaxID=171969 RepID=A0A9Q1KEE1_9CARY|nr:hypothetical protein Cgig2_023616 [Carnegiea gigantea]